MAEDDLQLRAFVEQAAADQPQRVHGGFGVERPVRAKQPRMPFVNLRAARQRVAWMQIERNVERFDGAPERAVLGRVVIDRAIGLFDLRETIYQRATKSELLDATIEFGDGGFRV